MRKESAIKFTFIEMFLVSGNLYCDSKNKNLNELRITHEKNVVAFSHSSAIFLSLKQTISIASFIFLISS